MGRTHWRRPRRSPGHDGAAASGVVAFQLDLRGARGPFVTLCWVPIFLAAHALTGNRSNEHLLNVLFSGAFLLSLLHQPLTLALVYGDKSQFALRRRLFTWSPIVAVALIAVAVVLDLWIIIPIAAIWNTIHTLQQRYGLSRDSTGGRRGSARRAWTAGCCSRGWSRRS